MGHSSQQYDWWRPPRRAPPNYEALFIRDYFRRWLARFKLGAHFLDLSCLFFQLGGESLYLFLQLLNFGVERRVGLSALGNGLAAAGGKSTQVSISRQHCAQPSIGIDIHETRDPAKV